MLAGATVAGANAEQFGETVRDSRGSRDSRDRRQLVDVSPGQRLPAHTVSVPHYYYPRFGPARLALIPVLFAVPVAVPTPVLTY